MINAHRRAHYVLHGLERIAMGQDRAMTRTVRKRSAFWRRLYGDDQWYRSAPEERRGAAAAEPVSHEPVQLELWDQI